MPTSSFNKAWLTAAIAGLAERGIAIIEGDASEIEQRVLLMSDEDLQKTKEQAIKSLSLRDTVLVIESAPQVDAYYVKRQQNDRAWSEKRTRSSGNKNGRRARKGKRK